jgi:orotidine-5'-phosphate decarboxylase
MSAEIFRQTIEQPSDRVIVALDNMDWTEANDVMGEVGHYVGLAKANALADQLGWEHAVTEISVNGLHTMADPKYKDVPSTMENHVQRTVECTPQFITIFADNTPEALQAAVHGKETGKSKIEKGFEGTSEEELARIGGLLGVTVLTSIGADECLSIYGDAPPKKVIQFARTAMEAGLDGIVCSGQELDMIRKDSTLDGLLTVVPAITPQWAVKAGDQKRIVTPTEALQRGADYLVIGRAITQPPEGISREEAAQRIAEELKEAA